MRYKLGSVYEAARFLQSMSHVQRSRLEAALVTDHDKIASAVLKALVELESGSSPGSRDEDFFKADTKRHYLKFKRKLEEHRLSNASINDLSKVDLHFWIKIKLTKQVLSARLHYKMGEPLTSKEILRDVYQKARRFELLSLQLESASLLKRISHCVDGDSEIWKRRVDEADEALKAFRRISEKFHLISGNLNFCEIKDGNSAAVLYSNSSLQCDLQKGKLMTTFINAFQLRAQGNYFEASQLARAMLRMVRESPFIFSKQYQLLLIQFALENMYFLKRKYVIQKAALGIRMLDAFPIYQSFPLFALYIFELFRQFNAPAIVMVVERIEKNHLCRNYMQIRQHLMMAKLHAKFLRQEYTVCLQLINRDILLSNITCVTQVMDLRILEIICLIEKRKIATAGDRIESFRKYIQRNLGGSEWRDMYVLVHKILVLVLKGKIERKGRAVLHSLHSMQKPLYSYQYTGLLFWLRGRIKGPASISIN